MEDIIIIQVPEMVLVVLEVLEEEVLGMTITQVLVVQETLQVHLHHKEIVEVQVKMAAQLTQVEEGEVQGQLELLVHLVAQVEMVQQIQLQVLQLLMLEEVVVLALVLMAQEELVVVEQQ